MPATATASRLWLWRRPYHRRHSLHYEVGLLPARLVFQLRLPNPSRIPPPFVCSTLHSLRRIDLFTRISSSANSGMQSLFSPIREDPDRKWSFDSNLAITRPCCYFGNLRCYVAGTTYVLVTCCLCGPTHVDYYDRSQTACLWSQVAPGIILLSRLTL
jgi:hypothetical protein